MPFNFARMLTVNHTLCGASDSVNFPLLISGSDSTLKTVVNGGHVQDAGGADILVFSDAALTTQLASEIEFYDGVNGVLVAWAKAPTVSHTVDQVNYVGYGNGSPPARTTNSWDANYKGVWHLGNGTVLNVADSTTNANNGTQHSGVTAVAGQVDGAASFASASSQYINTSNVLNLPQVTLECWVFLTGNPAANGHVIGCMDGLGSATFDKFFYIDPFGIIHWYVYDGAPKVITSGSAIALNAWVHLVGTADGTTSRLYINGSPSGSILAGNTFTGYTLPNFFINGSNGGGYSYITDKTDEVRASNLARSADWILTQYNNQHAPGNIGAPGFLTWGAEILLASAVVNQLPVIGVT